MSATQQDCPVQCAEGAEIEGREETVSEVLALSPLIFVLKSTLLCL